MNNTIKTILAIVGTGVVVKVANDIKKKNETKTYTVQNEKVSGKVISSNGESSGLFLDKDGIKVYFMKEVK